MPLDAIEDRSIEDEAMDKSHDPKRARTTDGPPPDLGQSELVHGTRLGDVRVRRGLATMSAARARGETGRAER